MKAERYDRLMARQQEISRKRLKRKVGTRQRVIIDEVVPARRGSGDRQRPQQGDAPQIDGTVFVAEPAAATGRRNRYGED